MDSPSLTDGNKLYLYRLLRDSVGCGKQTFSTRIEEALAEADLPAGDLGFDSTRDLLEALPEFVTLRVFKGGRVYATVTEMPEWDAALTSAEQGKTETKAGRPRKRKKGVKGLKPVRPKVIRKVEQNVAETDEAPKAPQIDDGALDTVEMNPVDGVTAEEVNSEDSLLGANADQETADAITEQEEPSSVTEDTDSSPAPSEDDVEPTGSVNPVETESEDTTPRQPIETASGIKLTVTYNPYTGSYEEQVIVAEANGQQRASTKPEVGREDDSHKDLPLTAGNRPQVPVQPHPAAASTAVKSAPTQAQPAMTHEKPQADTQHPHPSHKAAPVNPVSTSPSATARENLTDIPGEVPSALALRGYPRDLTRELHVPSDLLGMLVRIVPMGIDALGVLTEDFRLARGAGQVRGTRGKATFPLRYLGVNGNPVTIEITRQAGPGANWALKAIDNVSNDLIAQAGIDGLPLIERSAAQAAVDEAAMTVYLDDAAVSRLAAQAFPSVWSTETLRTHLAFAINNGAIEEDALHTGLFDANGDPLTVHLVPTDDDIPWRIA